MHREGPLVRAATAEVAGGGVRGGAGRGPSAEPQEESPADRRTALPKTVPQRILSLLTDFAGGRRRWKQRDNLTVTKCGCG